MKVGCDPIKKKQERTLMEIKQEIGNFQMNEERRTKSVKIHTAETIKVMCTL